jgi:hypothetical protein
MHKSTQKIGLLRPDLQYPRMNKELLIATRRKLKI